MSSILRRGGQIWERQETRKLLNADGSGQRHSKNGDMHFMHTIAQNAGGDIQPIRRRKNHTAFTVSSTISSGPSTSSSTDILDDYVVITTSNTAHDGDKATKLEKNVIQNHILPKMMLKPWIGPTIYVVQFPRYKHDMPLQSIHTITIRRTGAPQGSLPSCKVFRIPIPTNIKILGSCVVTLEHKDFNLNLERLVEELIHIGCGMRNLGAIHTSPLPRPLSNDGLLVAFWCSDMKTLMGNSGPMTSQVVAIPGERLSPNKDQPPVREGQPSISSYYGFSDDDGLNGPSPLIKQPKPTLTSKSLHQPAPNLASPGSYDHKHSNLNKPDATLLGNRRATSSPASFITAMSSYISSSSTIMDGPRPIMRAMHRRQTEPNMKSPSPLLHLRDVYIETLEQKGIIQSVDKEQNWSGKGQHVAFSQGEPIPLTTINSLGGSRTAQVDRVLCRRIALARKKMKCSKPENLADALDEVVHLQNLRHFHIVQLVGSYLHGRDFCILMYPAADCHLGRFLEETADMNHEMSFYEDYEARRTFLASAMCCVTSGIAFIHASTIRHMDIKPQNILVKRVPSGLMEYRIYITDFDLSRSFASQGHSQTEGPTALSPMYCAPEVFSYQSRGRKADIFSLGCVFVEILTVYEDLCPNNFMQFRQGEGTDTSFRANLPKVRDWITMHFGSGIPTSLRIMVRKMIDEHPEMRPTATDLADVLASLPQPFQGHREACCSRPPEPYEAYQGPASLNTTLLKNGLTGRSIRVGS